MDRLDDFLAEHVPSCPVSIAGETFTAGASFAGACDVADSSLLTRLAANLEDPSIDLTETDNSRVQRNRFFFGSGFFDCSASICKI